MSKENYIRLCDTYVKYEIMDEDFYNTTMKSLNADCEGGLNRWLNFQLFGIVEVYGASWWSGPDTRFGDKPMPIASNWEALLFALNQFHKRFHKSWTICQSYALWHLTIGGITEKYEHYPTTKQVARLLAHQTHHYLYKEAQEKKEIEYREKRNQEYLAKYANDVPF